MRHDYLIRKRDALLASSGLFWLPSGYSADDVFAAYLFKGVASADVSREDVTGHGYTLTLGSESGNSPSWDASRGWKFSTEYQGQQGYLTNSTLNGRNIKTAVVRYANRANANRCWLITAGGSSGLVQLCAATAVWDTDESTVRTYSGPGYPHGEDKWTYCSMGNAAAVVGANFGSSNKLYINGGHMTSYVHTINASTSKGSQQSWRTFGNTHAAISDLNNANHSGKDIICAAFFAVALTDEQHKEVAQRMAAL